MLSSGWAPERNRPSMKNLGVPVPPARIPSAMALGIAYRGNSPKNSKGRLGGGPLTKQMHVVYVCSTKRRKGEITCPETLRGLVSLREKRQGPPRLPGASLLLTHGHLHVTQITQH